MDSKLGIVGPPEAMRAGLEEAMRVQKENLVIKLKLKTAERMMERKDMALSDQADQL